MVARWERPPPHKHSNTTTRGPLPNTKSMKKLLHILLIAALFASCHQDEPVNPTPEECPIQFGDVQTRAAVSDIQDNGFGVWAFISNSLQTNFTLMDNVKVQYNEGAWKYSPVVYWIDDTRFSFVATYPYDAAGTDFKFDSENTVITLGVSETPSEVDYLMATHEANTGDENFDFSAPVPLQFQHMLSNVSLNIWRDGAKHQNDQMRIRKVTLSNIRKGGTYSSSTKTWTPTNDKLNLSYETSDDMVSDSDNIGAVIVKDDGTLEAGGSTPSKPFSDMLLIPQTLDASNSISLKIQYELKRNNAASWEKAELETVLPNITWEAGRRYTYNIVLSSVTDITIYYIQTKVDPWGTPQVGGTVIIK